MKNTINEWLGFIDQSLSNLKSEGILVEAEREIDITDIIPSLKTLKEKNIKILNTPHFVNHKSEDCLKRKQIEVDDLDDELDKLTHIYNITVTQAMHYQTFTKKYTLIVRGVWK